MIVDILNFMRRNKIFVELKKKALSVTICYLIVRIPSVYSNPNKPEESQTNNKFDKTTSNSQRRN